ncbi:MAG: hypothetical protein JNL01_04145 [Bdellovibrionales bacterium]|nr:hypothetical protein [Bdellovibrionales bacterium]
MKKLIWILGMIAVAALGLAACIFQDRVPANQGRRYQGLEVEKTTERFLEENGMDFSTYVPSMRSLEECPESYSRMLDTYLTSGRPDEVFQKFIQLSPLKAWNGFAQFDLLYDRKTARAYDRNTVQFPEMSTGQIYILKLKIAPGLNIPVAFEFVQVDPKKLQLSFSYLTTNKSRGIQQITFLEDGLEAGKVKGVRVNHISCYSSGSDFRDQRLYPRFHRKMLDNFYENAFANIQGKPVGN